MDKIMDKNYGEKIMPTYPGYGTTIYEWQPGYTGRRYNGLGQQIYSQRDLYNALQYDPVARNEYISKIQSLPQYNNMIPNGLWDIMAQQGYAQDILNRSNSRMNVGKRNTKFYKQLINQLFERMY